MSLNAPLHMQQPGSSLASGTNILLLNSIQLLILSRMQEALLGGQHGEMPLNQALQH